MEHSAYLSLGTNLGDKEHNIHAAIQKIEEQVGKVFSRSALCVTAPWGFESDHEFLNCAVGVRTVLSPHELLSATQCIEKELGRTRKSVGGQYSDRLIDIDILFYDRLVMADEVLTLPHPLLHLRDFVLGPMAEIAPDLLHPVLKKTIATLRDEVLR